MLVRVIKIIFFNIASGGKSCTFLKPKKKELDSRDYRNPGPGIQMDLQILVTFQRILSKGCHYKWPAGRKNMNIIDGDHCYYAHYLNFMYFQV